MDMMDTETGHSKSELVQTTISSAFFKPRSIHASSSTFSKSIQHSSSDSQEPPVKEITQEMPRLNLCPERRSQKPRSAPTPNRPNRKALFTQIAAETKSLLPNILETTPNAPPDGHLYGPKKHAFPLDQQKCPHLPKTAIHVLNSDTIDAALSLSASLLNKSSKPVLVLNMANAYHSGGGWLHGALAQEEALCYRSSLSFTLKNRYYPMPEAGGIYSPTVVVIRENMANGHKVLDLKRPEDLPVISVASVAAINGPEIAKEANGKETYKVTKEREVMKEKMRVVLRIAAINRHRVLVLGALGCGAFGNPRGEVVECWKEVFAEKEFNAGWWEAVVFAVFEPSETKEGNGNFGVFWRGLEGVMV